jgi:hypothetical protein
MEIKAGNIYYLDSEDSGMEDELILIIGKKEGLKGFWEYEYQWGDSIHISIIGEHLEKWTYIGRID